MLFSNFRKTWSNLHLCKRGPIKSVLFICPSVCLSVCLWHIFLRIYSVQWMFLIFCMRIFCQILEICICFLDNWLNKTNLDKKQNIWHFMGQYYFLCFKWCNIFGYVILWKLRVWGKSGSQFICQNALHQSDCRIFWTLKYVKNYLMYNVHFLHVVISMEALVKSCNIWSGMPGHSQQSPK